MDTSFRVVDGILRLADCGINDWRFYQDKKAYISGLVQGTDKTGMQIAVWHNSENIYEPGASKKLVSKPFDAFKNNYGSAWIKKATSARSVNVRRLKSLIHRSFSGNIHVYVVGLQETEQNHKC